jgi:tetratricopeptide (TPR) repeat protein
MKAIMNIEETMKKAGKKKSVRMLVLVSLMLFMPLSAMAITKQNADNEYKKGNYQQAIKDYQELLKKGVSADLYYNLGNAYFRTDNITQAVLAYERALLLQPGDKDIRFNLQFARSKTIDKITPESEMFFFTWYRSVVNMMSVDSWATLAVVSIVLALVLVLFYLFSSRLLMRQVGFYGSICFFVLFLLGNLFAWQQKQQLVNHRGAIVIAPSTTVKKTPAKNGTDDFVIHEGTKVNVTDKSIKEWRGVRLDDGREGWISADVIEEI